MSAVIVVVGIGADGMAGLSESSQVELRSATVIYGSRRQLDLLDSTVPAPRHEWPSPMLPALQTLREGHAGDIHVVASGDPLLHGIGGTLIRVHGPANVRVLPHVSSVTLACARMGWNVQDTEVVSLVTAQTHTAVRRGGRAIVLSRGRGTPAALAELLTEHGRGDSAMTVLEQLGGPAERRGPGGRAQVPVVGPRSRPRTSTISTSSLSITCPTSASRRCPTTRSPTTGRSRSWRSVRPPWLRWARARGSCCGMSAPARAASACSGA